MKKEELSSFLLNGQGILGIELGSTRIKAVLIDDTHAPIAMGAYDWKNRLENGIWTYALSDVWRGIQSAYAALCADVNNQYGVALTNLAGIGISAMMHGYLPFDRDGHQLVPFRTWRNTVTADSARTLTELFHFNIPQRWSIAHLDQAMQNGEKHVENIAFLTTLAGYVHWKLTGRKFLGVGDASGMFPIDSRTNDYDQAMIASFDKRAAAYPWKLRDILPTVLNAGEDAGSLTAEGALLLDPTGQLQAGIPCCPPEGDAGTGMTATDSVAAGTGNVSAGTSVFAMVVLENALRRVYPEIDMVTTPNGKPVAMVHCNNCTSDINAWADMLTGFAQAASLPIERRRIFTTLFSAAMQGDKDCDGLINVNYLSGEPITSLSEGRPMMVRLPDTKLTFANFARSLVFGAMATLKLGMDILSAEQVSIYTLLGHGGFFKTPETAQNLLASALNTPVSVMETAGEGGPWGMALLAAYRVRKVENESLEDYLARHVFANAAVVTAQPDPDDAAGFARYTERFKAALAAEKAAAEQLR